MTTDETASSGDTVSSNDTVSSDNTVSSNNTVSSHEAVASDETTSARSVKRRTVVVDLGTQKKQRIKKLRRGDGRLMQAVDSLIDQIETDEDLVGDILPVVVVVRERRKKRKLLGWI